MNQSSLREDLRKLPAEEKLDRVLSDFFKSKMKQPWPAAPTTPSRMPIMEPSLLAATRTAFVETSRNQPVETGNSRDGGSKSRYTLAMSVAMLLGTCWYLSNGFQQGERVAPAGNTTPKVFNVLPESGAEKPAALEQIRKDKAENGNQDATQPKIQIP
jgi:hypothetical protein